MLDRIKSLINDATDDDILWKKWNTIHKSWAHRDYLWRYLPSTQKYYFEGNPSFIFEYKDISNMEIFPIIMLRDGLLPLIWFFYNYHKPPLGFDTITLIPKRFEGLVPKSWQRLVATYEVDYLNHTSDKASKLYITGNANSYSFWKNDVEDVLKNLKSATSEQEHLEFLVPLRERSIFNDFDETRYVSLFIEKIHKLFANRNFNLRTDQDKFEKIKFKKNHAFCDLCDEKLIVYDNYLHHYMAAKGLRKFKANEVSRENSLVYSLSLYHNIVIKEVEFEENYFNELAFYLKSNMVSNDFMSVHFHAAIKKLIKSSEIIL